MQLISADHKFFYQAGIFYHNISIVNIFFKEDKSNCFLIDLDLAVDIRRLKTSEAFGKIGTKVFMAIGALDGDSHTFIHDLKSLF